MSRLIPALLLGLGLGAVTAAPALADSLGTARASATLDVREGPGRRFEIIGKLSKDTRVHLRRCTRDSDWCLVVLDGEPLGWVLGSYLVGSGAKVEVTPSNLFEHSPFNDWFEPWPFRHPR